MPHRNMVEQEPFNSLFFVSFFLIYKHIKGKVHENRSYKEISF